ncbi:hypothetical protein Ancab_005727 [Ancistrocladus abbreviatus]
MKENGEMLHICKLCNKSFSNGKSLGAYKRCHLHAIGSAKNCKKMNDSEMGLLENTRGKGRGRPKKSWMYRTCVSNLEIDLELEEIALCLLMLSRGDGGGDGLKSWSQSCSKNDYVNSKAKLSVEDTNMAKYDDNYDDEERMLWNPTIVQ